MKKVTTALVAAIISISVAVPFVTQAQTTTSSEASLIAVLTQLVQLLEQELHQLVAAQGRPTTPTTSTISNNSTKFIASPTFGGAPLTVTFSNLSTTAAEVHLYFGDGQESSDGETGYWPNGGVVVRTYTKPGIYTAYLAGEMSEGILGTATITVTSTNSTQPSASLSASPTSGAVPLTVAFTGIASTSVYDLNFGDGTGTTGQCPQGWCALNVSHTYQNAGTYTVKLFQQTNLCGDVQLYGCASKLQIGSVTITVSPASQPTATIDQALSTIQATPSTNVLGGAFDVSGFSGTASGVTKVSVVALVTGNYTGPTDFTDVQSNNNASYTGAGVPLVLSSKNPIGRIVIPVVNGVWQTAGIDGLYPPKTLTILVYDASVSPYTQSTPLARTTVNVVAQ